MLCDQVTFRTFYSPILGGILRYVWLNSVYHTHFTTVKHSVSPTIFSWFSYHATCRIEYSLIKIRSPRLLPISYRLFNSRRVEAPVPVFGIQYTGVRIRVMVFNATFNNISAISWRSVLLMEEIGELYQLIWKPHTNSRNNSNQMYILEIWVILPLGHAIAEILLKLALNTNQSIFLR